MTPELAADILIFDDNDEIENYKEVDATTMTSISRWSIHYEKVYQNINDKTFWKIKWTRGATEYQDNGYENIEVHQVVPREITSITYVKV